MKTPLSSLIAGIAVFLSGCSTGHQKLVLDPVGPPPLSPVPVTPQMGTLVVYSANEVNADFNARDPDRPEYSDYEILAKDGKLVRRVHNNSGTILQEAVPVPLACGNYLVVARANGYGAITVPVEVAAGQTTSVHLEGGRWRNESALNQTNAVRLPDGQIVGWKSRFAGSR